MSAIPGFDPSLEYVFDVEVSAILTISPGEEPTVQELKNALFDEFMDYLNQIPESDFEEFAALHLKATHVDTRRLWF